MANTDQKKQKRQLRILENVHGAMGCFLYIIFSIVGVVISISVLLFVAEIMFPKRVQFMNKTISTRTFIELKSAHKYQAAVNLYEHKKEIFTDFDEKSTFMMEVFDCYKRIGEYEKAESILKDLYDFENNLTDKEKESFENEPLKKELLNFFKFGIAKDFVNLYEETGNIAGQEYYYSVMKECLPDAEYINDTLSGKFNFGIDIKMEDIIKSYDYKIMYYTSPEEAISGMSDYIYKDILSNDNITNTYNYNYLLKCMNILINWIIDNHGIMEAYPFISDAVDLALNTDYNNHDKSEYGNLSDICYKVHDIKNSKMLYNIYSTYLQETTSTEDPLYIDNMVRGFRFLENDGDWEELEYQVIDCCTSLKSLLDKNIHTMSESQREYFVDLLDGPFDYATNLLYYHPSDKLAALCFENSIYMKGLLLRSNRELANKIQSKGDAQLIAMYEDLQEYRKELSYKEYIGGIGNTIKIKQLRNDIENLDKQLSSSCQDYLFKKESTIANIRSISKIMKHESAVIDFIETNSDNLIALVLTKGENVKAVNIGNKKDVLKSLHSDYRLLYSEKNITNLIWGPIKHYIPNIKHIYYTTDGVFNSISFQALSLGSREHLVDQYDFHLLSNISNIMTIQENTQFDPLNTKLAMWGDIDYGNKDDIKDTEESIFRDIVRGDNLRNLRYSKNEVIAIKGIVDNHNGKTFVYTGASASEYSFHSRSGMGDNILHISTHGFFDEDDIHRKDYNPMYNSGLFFAGADSSWNNNDTISTIEAMTDDGILRADEIQYLNFSDCSLAVLSACKTGLGHSSNTEGVYGLQRAFKLAGVDKILMSLWNVDDKCTSELMQEFYSYYFSGFSDEEALRKAQSAIRKKYPSPEYWGAFVLLY